MAPSLKRLFHQFLPLALSGLFFPIARPLINAALARTSDPERALAVFAVSLSITMPLISPLFGLRQVSTALSSDQDMLGRIRKLTLFLGSTATLILLILAHPALFQSVVQRLMGIPPEIASIGPPVLFVLALTPLIAVGRGYYQGILVRYGKAGPIGTGALGYLLSIALCLWVGITLTHIEGALLAAISLLIGQITYLIIVWRPSRPIISQTMPPTTHEIPTENRTYRYLVLFYLPLAIATILLALIEPAIQTAMARAPCPRASLAAYPVASALIWMARTPLWNAQQIVIAEAANRQSYQHARQFMLLLSLGLCVLMVIPALPGLEGFVFEHLLGVTGKVKELALGGYWWMIPLTFSQGIRSLYHGTLIRQNATRHIQHASVARTLGLLVILPVAVWIGNAPGLYLAIWANLFSEGIEIFWLRRGMKRIVWPIPPSSVPSPAP